MELNDSLVIDLHINGSPGAVGGILKGNEFPPFSAPVFGGHWVDLEPLVISGVSTILRNEAVDNAVRFVENDNSPGHLQRKLVLQQIAMMPFSKIKTHNARLLMNGLEKIKMALVRGDELTFKEKML